MRKVQCTQHRKARPPRRHEQFYVSMVATRL